MFRTVHLSTIRSFTLHTQQWCMYGMVWYGMLYVQCETPDDGQRNCPKHVEFYSKINLRN